MQRRKDEQLVNTRQELVQLRHDLASTKGELSHATLEHSEALSLSDDQLKHQLRNLQSSHQAVESRLDSTRTTLVRPDFKALKASVKRSQAMEQVKITNPSHTT
jgi:hypothetical protein